MKLKHLLVVALSFFLILSCNSKKEGFNSMFSFLPEKPKQGEQITVKYNPQETELEKAGAVEMIAYLYGNDLNNTQSVTMKKKGSGWIGSLQTNDSTYGVVIKFVNDKISDNNNEKGYVIKLYNNKGVVPGANAGLANLYIKYARQIGLKSDAGFISQLLNDEFTRNPEVKENFLEAYFMSVPRTKRDSVINFELNRLAEKENLTDDDLLFLTKWYLRTGNFVQSSKYEELCVKQFPKSVLAKAKEYKLFQAEKDMGKRIEILNSFIKKFNDSNYESTMLYKIITSLGRKKEYKKAAEILNKYPNLVNANMYNALAWPMFESKENIPLAVNFAKKAVDIAKKEISSKKETKPVFLTEKEWKQYNKVSLGIIQDTYANVLIENGEKEKAAEVYNEAVENTNKEMPDINDGYASLLIKLKKYDKAKEILKVNFENGKITDKTSELFHKAFIAAGGTEEELNKFLAKYENEAEVKMKEKLKKEMMNEPASQFTLTDINGKKVSLSDFKGNPVIVDFWATWCGPCVSSFPAMATAQEKLKNEHVKFLFINTWERGVDNKTKNAADFIKKNKYPFHVLIDEKNEVVGNYGVEGIPTKFIIDKNGKIRFKSVGFSGSAEELVNELTEMIKLIK